MTKENVYRVGKRPFGSFTFHLGLKLRDRMRPFVKHVNWSAVCRNAIVAQLEIEEAAAKASELGEDES